MTNYVNKQVLRLTGVTDPNLINSDNDFQLGTITLEVGPKVRIRWDHDDSVEYLDKGKLHGWDKTTFTVIALEPDNTVSSVKSDKTDEPAPKPRTVRSRAKVAESTN